MAEITFTFMDFNSKADLGLVVNNIEREVLPDAQVINTEVPGMLGNIFEGTSYGSRKFSVEVSMLSTSEEERVRRLHELSNLFMAGGQDEWDLHFSDEPEINYYAHVASISEPARLSEGSSAVSFTIEFECSDPLGRKKPIEDVLEATTTTFTMEGNAPTRPIFTCVPTKAINTVSIVGADETDNNYVTASNFVDVDTQDVPVDREPVVLADRMNDLGPWTKLSQSTVTWNFEGNAKVSNGAFRTTTNTITNAVKDGKPYFGKHIKGAWYGPASQRALPSSYNDWRLRYRVQFNNGHARAKSKIELYLLDSIGKRIGVIGIKDNDYSKRAELYVRLGHETGKQAYVYKSEGTVYDRGKTKTTVKTITVGKKKVTTKNKAGKKKTVEKPITKKLSLRSDPDTSSFTTFYGWIDVRKVGNKVLVTVCKTDDQLRPMWTKKIKYTLTSDMERALKLAQVAIYSAKYGIAEDETKELSYKNAQMYHADLNVWEIKDGGNKSVSATPFALAGQEIVLDFEEGKVSVDGEDKTNQLYIGSNFFDFNGGETTTFTVSPPIEEAKWWMFRVPKVH